MKIRIVLFLAFICFSGSYAQMIENYGFKAGANLSHMEWNYKPSFNFGDFVPDDLFSFNFGLFMESKQISGFKFLAELNYERKGCKKEFPMTTPDNPDGTGQTALWKISFDYLNLSLLAKYNVFEGIVSPYLIAGPRADIQLAKNTGSDIAGFYDDFKKFRPGYKVGVGADVNIAGKDFLAEIIYDGDFSGIYENENVVVNTRSVDFRIGMKF